MSIQLNRTRLAVAKFGSEVFSTTQIRNEYNASNIKAMLQTLSDLGEIEFLGKAATGGSPRGMWRCIRLKQVVKSLPPIGVKPIEPDNLPGWRSVFPEMFTDPQLKGVGRIRMEIEL